ncbi:MAG: VOC family protein [Bdellovibrionales bacterium]|nr:VOC family protein [Bdellovibrionales bacterium]
MPINSVLQLPCSDPERTKKFFVDQLGFECKKDYTDVFVVAKDSIELSYWKVSPSEDAVLLARNADYFVRVNNLTALMQEFEASDLDFEAKVERQPWGGVELHISDPDGNRIRFVE